jgi:hypothetical protein
MTTYPSEAWPADTAVEALDGTTDAGTGLPYIAKGTGPTSVPSYEVQYNRRQERLSKILAGWRQGMVVDEGGLKIGVYPIDFTLGGARRSFAGASGVSVPDEASKVVYLDSVVTLQIADAWPADLTAFLPLAIVEASNGQMTVWDRRGFTAFQVPAVAQDRHVVTAHRASVSTSQSDVEVFEFDPPADLTLEEVQVYCSAVTATASVDVKEAGASVLSAPATPAAGAVVKPAVSDGAVSGDNTLTIHVTTDGTGSITNLSVTLLFTSA